MQKFRGSLASYSPTYIVYSASLFKFTSPVEVWVLRFLVLCFYTDVEASWL